LADLLLVDCNPLENVEVVGEPEIPRLIIKDGYVCENVLR
jgi:imidazolonepropionase-like amidohydrolase